MGGVKRNWRSYGGPIYVPLEPVHLWWLLPVFVTAVLVVLAATLGLLYLIVEVLT